MQVMVVGGAENLVKGNLGRKLRDAAIDVEWHVPYKKRKKVDNIPSGCEGVVVIKDMISHPLHDSVAKLAAKANIPVAVIQRKWAHAEPVLRSRGFMPAAQKASAHSQEHHSEMALDYIRDERRRGRVPKQDEVDAMLQRAFGGGAALRNREEFFTLHSMASAEVPLSTDKSDKEMHADLIQYTTEWATALIGDRPEWVLDAPACRQAVREQVGPQSASLNQERLDQCIKRAHDGLVFNWAKDKPLRRSLIEDWLARLFVEFRDEDGPWPSQRLCREGSDLIFGVQSRWDWAIEQRAKVLGEWARALQGSKNVYESLVLDLEGVNGAEVASYEQFKALLENGTVQGVKPNGKTWQTSKTAVHEYLTKRTMELVDFLNVAIGGKTPTEEPAPQETPASEPVPAPVPTTSAEDIAVIVADLVERKVKEAITSRLGDVTKLLSQQAATLLLTAKTLASMSTRFDDYVAEMVGLGHDVGKLLDDQTVNAEVIERKLTDIEGALDGDLSLRALGELAENAGLKVTVETTGG